MPVLQSILIFLIFFKLHRTDVSFFFVLLCLQKLIFLILFKHYSPKRPKLKNNEYFT